MSMFDYRNFLFPFGGGTGGSVKPPLVAKILQWLLGTSNGLNVDDKLDIVNPEPIVKGVSVLNFAAGGTITSDAFVLGDTLTQNGTATLTSGEGVITVGVGTVSQITLNGDLTFPCEEGALFPLNVDALIEPNVTAISGGVWASSDVVPSWNLSKGCNLPVAPDLSKGWTPAAYGGFSVLGIDYDTLAQNVTIVADSDESAGFGFSEDGLTLVLCNDESKMFSYTCAVPFQVDALTPITTHTLSPQKNFISFNISPDGTHVIQWETGTKTVYHHKLSTPWDITTATLSESKALTQAQQSKGIWVSRDGTKMVTPGWSTLQDTSLWTFGTPWDASTLTLDHSHFIQNTLVFSRMTFSEDGTTCICGLNGTNTYQYNFATPWDLTSAEPVITKGSENNYWNAGIWMNVDQSFLFTLRDNRNMKVYTTGQGAGGQTAIIPALADGSAAADGSAITSPSGKYNNGFEGSIIEAPTAFKVIDEITVTDTQGVHVLTKVSGLSDGKPWYEPAGAESQPNMKWDETGGYWLYQLTGSTGRYKNTTSTTFPPQTGAWVLHSGSGDPPTDVAYDSYMVENSEFVPKTFLQDLGHFNTTGRVVDQWEKPGGVCLLKERLVYSQSTEMTGEWIQGAEKWATKYTVECGTFIDALRDVNGILILDSNGDIITTFIPNLAITLHTTSPLAWNVAVGHNGAALGFNWREDGGDITFVPHAPSNGFSINLPAGSTDRTFEIWPANNAESDTVGVLNWFQMTSTGDADIIDLSDFAPDWVFAEVTNNTTLTHLDVSDFTAMTNLYAYNNTELLTVTGDRCGAYQADFATDAKLTSVSFTNCPRLREVIGHSNPLLITADFSGSGEDAEFELFNMANCTSMTSLILPTGFKLGDHSSSYYATVNVTNGNLSGTALDAIYGQLGDVSGYGHPAIVHVTGNPGTATHTPTIATNKGWVVDIT